MPKHPPYAVPSMEDIREIQWNGFRVASTFSGCGGSSLGYRMAGFRVVYASEFIPEAQATYRANSSDKTFLDVRDIRQVSPSDILSHAGLNIGELDLLDGSPPCASFSTAGKRDKHWGKEKKYSDKSQRTDDLFFEFSRILNGVQPKVFVAENVSGLIKGRAKGYFLEILKELKSCGYNVKAQLLDAQWLGVPQMRQRIIFVGVRSDFNKQPVFPKPLPYRYAVKDAIPWAVVGGGGMNTSQFGIELEADISKYAIGTEWDNLKMGGQSDKYFQLVRSHLEKPVQTITASGGTSSLASVTHPTEKRKFSIAELRRLCGFPDDFILTGSYSQQWERLGRSVPPVMMNYIASTIRDEILNG